MYTTYKKEIIKTALEIKASGLVMLSGGNVSARMSRGEILVTPSGSDYATMQPDDIVMVDINGKVLEGSLKPSVDLEALLYIYRNKPEVNGIIHTHQPYATAVGLVADELPVCVTTLANVTLGAVRVARYGSAACLDMGVAAVEYLGSRRAVILKHHGVLTVGGNLKEALYAAVYMEEAAKAYLLARGINSNIPVLDHDQTLEAIEAFKRCGQAVKYDETA